MQHFNKLINMIQNIDDLLNTIESVVSYNNSQKFPVYNDDITIIPQKNVSKYPYVISSQHTTILQAQVDPYIYTELCGMYGYIYIR